MKTFWFILFLFISVFNVGSQVQVDWSRTLGGSETDGANFIEQTEDGGYIVAGYSESSDYDLDENRGFWDVWILKLDGSGQTEWKRNYGGSLYETARVIRQTEDGGFVFIGWTRSSDGDVAQHAGNNDIWVVKLDEFGEIEWERTYGDAFHNKGYMIRQTKDLGYVVCGYWSGVNGDGNGIVLKLDEEGGLEWQSYIGGDREDEANSIVEISSGGYMLVGTREANYVEGSYWRKDCFVTRLAADGEILWTENYGKDEDDIGNSIIESRGGDFIIAGLSKKIGDDVNGGGLNNNVWVFKIDEQGTLIWEQSLGGEENDFVISVEETDDQGYVLGGSTSSFDESPNSVIPDDDSWLIKLNEDGNLQWESRFGGADDDYCNYVHQTLDGGFIATGFSTSTDGDFEGNHGDRDMWVMKILPVVTKVEELQYQEISMFPNPASDFIFLQDPTFAQAGYEYQIVNMQGKLMSAGKLKSLKIDISTLLNGQYQLYLKSTDESTEINYSQFQKY